MIERVKNVCRQGLQFLPAQISLAHAFFPSQENLVDCRALGVALAVQPLLMYVFEREMAAAWGAFAQQATPLATMLAADVLAAGGSDVLPCEPLSGARMAVERKARQGMKLADTESIAPRRALELFTSHAGPYVQRTDVGMIAPGYCADFVVWSANPLLTPPDEWLSLRVQVAAIAGEVVLEE